jgi:hypothetical protein
MLLYAMRWIIQHFEGSLLADDYLGRVEMELAKIGFNSNTAIGKINKYKYKTL